MCNTEKPIRLIFLCNAPPVMAGVEKTALILNDRISRDAFDVRFILNGSGPFYDALKRQDADVECIPCRQRYSLTWHREVVRSLRARPADIIQLHVSRLNALFLRLHTDAPFVERLNMTRHRSFLYPMQWKWLDRQMARFIDHFIVVSESLKEQFLRRGYPAKKMTVVHNGIEIPDNLASCGLREQLALSADTPLVGTLGRLVPQKGMRVFVKTAEIIAQKQQNVHFVVVGKGELRPELERQCHNAGLEQRVHFLGYRDDVMELLNEIDIFLYLSRWEPFANTILEAMAVGTAIVATNVGGNAEAIKDHTTGRLVEPDAPRETAQIVTELLEDRPQRRRLENKTRRAVTRWSVDNMIKGHEEVYRKVLLS